MRVALLSDHQVRPGSLRRSFPRPRLAAPPLVPVPVPRQLAAGQRPHTAPDPSAFLHASMSAAGAGGGSTPGIDAKFAETLALLGRRDTELFAQGCEVELVGLASAALNGRRGRITGQLTQQYASKAPTVWAVFL